MSIKVMSAVWEKSVHDGSHLLAMLAIADFADDDGNAYPSVGKLATKCRMQSRNMIYVLQALEASEELAVLKNKGPRGTNRYRIVLEALGGAKDCTPASACTPATHCMGGVQPIAGEGVQCIAPEPSFNRQEPSVTESRDSVSMICPVQKIVELYHECMPDNPRVRTVDSARRKSITSRWKQAAQLDIEPFGYSNVEAGLRAWRVFFETCADSDFLTGKARATPGHQVFVADIDFLMRPQKFISCLENKYHREVAA